MRNPRIEFVEADLSAQRFAPTAVLEPIRCMSGRISLVEVVSSGAYSPSFEGADDTRMPSARHYDKPAPATATLLDDQAAT